jgi:hypothetical protein
MPVLQPQYLVNWGGSVATILATEVRGEFLNIYNLLNGNLDADNLANGSITSEKLANGSIGGDKIDNVPASKITGQFTTEQLPANVLGNGGGTVTGSIVYNVNPNTAFVKSYSNTEVVIAEVGTGTAKLQLTMNPTGDLLQIKQNGLVVFSVGNDGTVVPKKLQVPVI